MGEVAGPVAEPGFSEGEDFFPVEVFFFAAEEGAVDSIMVFIRFGGAYFRFPFVDIDDQIAGDPVGGFVGFVFENHASASGEALFDLEGV